MLFSTLIIVHTQTHTQLTHTHTHTRISLYPLDAEQILFEGGKIQVFNNKADSRRLFQNCNTMSAVNLRSKSPNEGKGVNILLFADMAANLGPQAFVDIGRKNICFLVELRGFPTS